MYVRREWKFLECQHGSSATVQVELECGTQEHPDVQYKLIGNRNRLLVEQIATSLRLAFKVMSSRVTNEPPGCQPHVNLSPTIRSVTRQGELFFFHYKQCNVIIGHENR